MAVRNESVRLSLEDAGFSTGMAKAAAATALLGGRLDDLDGSSVGAIRSLRDLEAHTDRVRSSARSASPEIDRLSGRVRLFADATAVLGPSLVPIGAVAVPAITGLASSLGFAAIGMTSLVAASQGVGDALKAVNEASLEPTAENLEKAREAMQKLGPEAQAFVARFQELRPVLGDIRDAAARGWFPGLTASLDDFERVAPRVASLFEAIGRTGGALVENAAEGLAGAEGQEFLAFAEREAPQALQALGESVGNVVAGMGRLWMATQPLNRGFSDWMLDASQAFADWADHVSSTAGFQEFLEYVSTNGPKVAALAMAVGDALLEIAEAAAPLGGPVLDGLTAFAKVLGAVADSDLGTPIFAAVAAYTALNRTLQVTAALQARINGGAAAAGAGGLMGSLRNLRSSQADMRALMATTAKGAAVLGGLTVAATGSADGIGLTNTASLGLMGTLAGPWGVAVGAGVGLTMDLVKANQAWAESIESVDAAIGSGDLDAMTSKTAELRDQLAELVAMESPEGFGDTVSSIAKAMGWWVSGAPDVDQRIAETEQQLGYLQSAAERSAAAQLGLSGGLQATARAAGLSVGGIAQLRAELAATQTLAWGAFDAQTQLGASLDGLQEAAARGARGINSTTHAGRENRAALSRVASSWAATKVAMEANHAPAGRIEARYNQVRRAVIQAGIGMGLSRREAVRLANQLDKPMTIVIRSRHQEAVASAQAAMAGLRASIQGNPITQLIQVRRQYGPNATVSNAPLGGGTIPGSADGGTIPKTGLPYADRHLFMLADGEEVISNRYGQADRHRELLKAINDNRLADGGTVAPYKAPKRQEPVYHSVKFRPSFGGASSTTVRHEIHVTVSGEMDLERAKGQIRQVAVDVSRNEIDQAETWRRTQR